MKRVLLFLFVGVALGLASCNKEDEVINRDVDQSMDKILVSPNFDWKTTRDLTLNLTGYTQGLVKVESPKGVVYQSAFLLKYQTYEMKLTIPAYEKRVVLVFQDQRVEVGVETGVVNHRFVK